MAVTTNTYAVQRVFTIRAFDLVTNECLGTLKDLKDSNLSMGGELVYATGGVGNPKIVSFGHSAMAKLTATNALIDFNTNGIVMGAVPTIGTSTKYVHTDFMTAGTNTATTQYTALGTVGAEIKYVYTLNADGSLGTKYTQNATATTGKFAYAFATKTITFFTGEVPVGTKLVAFYNCTLGLTTRTIAKKTDVFPKQVKLVADTLFKDTCTGVEYGGQVIIWNAMPSQTLEFALSADGEPAVQAVEFEALKNCLSNDLVTMMVFDQTETT